jgi:hypothetical protein
LSTLFYKISVLSSFQINEQLQTDHAKTTAGYQPEQLSANIRVGTFAKASAAVRSSQWRPDSIESSVENKQQNTTAEAATESDF